MSKNEKSNDKNPTQYKATLTLTQNGLDGDVESFLEFEPTIKLDNLESMNTEGQLPIPAAYFHMANLFQAFLESEGILDANGQIIDEDEAHLSVNINASDYEGKPN